MHAVETGMHAVERSIHAVKNGMHAVESGMHAAEGGMYAYPMRVKSSNLNPSMSLTSGLISRRGKGRGERLICSRRGATWFKYTCASPRLCTNSPAFRPHTYTHTHTLVTVCMITLVTAALLLAGIY